MLSDTIDGAGATSPRTCQYVPALVLLLDRAGRATDESENHEPFNQHHVFSRAPSALWEQPHRDIALSWVLSTLNEKHGRIIMMV